MPATHHPRFETYNVVDAHTGAVVSSHGTRREATSAKRDHSHRVRGGVPAGATESLLAAFVRRLTARR